MRGDAKTVYLIIPAHQGTRLLDVRRVDARDCFAGNSAAAIRPAHSYLEDVDADHVTDLVLEYQTAAVRDMVTASAGLETVGLHFVDDKGVDRLVEDIFALGAPLPFTPGTVEVPPSGGSPQRTNLTWIQPNPFNLKTTVAYDLATPQRVRITVYDLGGHLVRTLVEGSQPAGRHGATWDGRDDAGRPVTSGVYLFRLETRDVQYMKKGVLIK